MYKIIKSKANGPQSPSCTSKTSLLAGAISFVNCTRAANSKKYCDAVTPSNKKTNKIIVPFYCYLHLVQKTLLGPPPIQNCLSQFRKPPTLN